MGAHRWALRHEYRRKWGGGRRPTSPHSSQMAVHGCSAAVGCRGAGRWVGGRAEPLRGHMRRHMHADMCVDMRVGMCVRRCADVRAHLQQGGEGTSCCGYFLIADGRGLQVPPSIAGLLGPGHLAWPASAPSMCPLRQLIGTGGVVVRRGCLLKVGRLLGAGTGLRGLLACFCCVAGFPRCASGAQP